MDYVHFPIKGTAFVIIITLLIAILTVAQIGSRDTHEFMNDPNRCHECHIGEPVFGETVYSDLRFTDDIVNLCHKCHSEESLGRSHPVNIRPPDEMEIPEDLHLDDYLKITCATCHQPHGNIYTKLKPTDFESPIGRRQTGQFYRSYFLRRTNIQNALCFACHKE